MVHHEIVLIVRAGFDIARGDPAADAVLLELGADGVELVATSGVDAAMRQLNVR